MLSEVYRFDKYLHIYYRMRTTRKRMTRKQRHYKKRTQRVRKMRGGVILKKSANDKNYLTYTGTVVDKDGKEVTHRDFLKIDEESVYTIYDKLKEHAEANFNNGEIIEKGYSGDNGNGMITVRISPSAIKNNGSTVKVIAKDLKPMEFKIGGTTYTMNFKVDFGN